MDVPDCPEEKQLPIREEIPDHHRKVANSVRQETMQEICRGILKVGHGCHKIYVYFFVIWRLSSQKKSFFGKLIKNCILVQLLNFKSVKLQFGLFVCRSI